MENRYLYKAKTTPKEKGGEFNNIWVIGNLIVSNGKYYIHPVGNIVNVKNEIGRIIVMHEVIPDTICQCTGLKDKNGKLIWENDIANCMDAECCGYISWNESEAGFYFDVLLEDGRFEEEHIYDYQDCMEVIGNTFDNPELLEVQNEEINNQQKRNRYVND